ncbi:MAG TPA: aldehyde dehydrogenase family protein, partial [Polyangia bacterium]|nr:aldehyde dehydrogenase family protein [Polyangia bacterium]
MSLRPILVAGEWRAASNPSGTFSAIDPATKAALPERFPVSGLEDVERACQAATEAAAALRTVPRESIGRFLDAYADAIEGDADELVALAARETGLPASPRLRLVELPRTANQLRQGAAAVRDRSWCQATIDTKANLRSYLGPLGPVAVFAPNNFPFAFNAVAGGDFVGAIAAGNPVIAKANPGHPGTSARLAEHALTALRAAGLPLATVQLLYHTPPAVGLKLVAHPGLGATAFTGSKEAGLQLKAAAERAGKPIYLEMSSVNPVFVL